MINAVVRISMMVNDMMSPATMATGVSLLRSVEYAMTPGRSGNTQGDATLRTPPINAVIYASMLSSKVLSSHTHGRVESAF